MDMANKLNISKRLIGTTTPSALTADIKFTCNFSLLIRAF